MNTQPRVPIVSLWVWAPGNSNKDGPNSPWQLTHLIAPTEHLILVIIIIRRCQHIRKQGHDFGLWKLLDQISCHVQWD